MPSATAAAATAAVATAGNPNAGQRGKSLQLPRFRVRVLDPVTGAVVIDKLPHIVVEYETIFPQMGMAGTSTIGHFVVHLFHPLTDEYAWYKAWYDKLDHVQRVEIYMVDDPDGFGATGDPVFTGIITNLPKEDFSFRVEGEDSLKLLDLSRTLQSDTFTGSTSDLVKYALKTYQLTKGDDWTGTLAAYTNDGTWALTTDQGFKSVKSGFASDGLLFTTAIYANSKYADCFVEAPFRLTCAAGTGATVEAGIVAAVADSSNLVLGRAMMRFVAGATATAPGRFEIDAEIWQKVGGAYGTVKAQTKAVIVETTGNTQVTVTLQGVQTTAYQYTWTVLLNEIDSKCSWVQSTVSGNPTGGIGLRGNWAVGVGSVTVQHHLVFMSKSNTFQPGNITTGLQRVNQPIASQQNIDLLSLAATTEGNVWRKNPKAGLNQDTVDYGVSVGGDLSGIVRLEQDIHIVSSQTEANAEPLNNAVLAAGHLGYNNSGLTRWYDIDSISKRGLVIGSAVIPHSTDTFTVRQMAQNVLLKRKQPTQAGRMTVLRHEDHAELPGQPKPTGLAYREGDWVAQHEPRKGINYKRAQVMSVKVTGGIPTMELTLDQYPIYTDRMPLVDRLNRVVEAAQLHRSDNSIKDPATGISYDRRMVLPNNPWKMRVTLSGNQTITLLNGTTLITFDTSSPLPAYDTSMSFNATTHQWTVPVSGFYFFSASLDITVPSQLNNNQVVATVIYVNNALTARGAYTPLYQGAGIVINEASSIVADSFYVNAGDLVDVRLNCVVGNNLTVNATTGLTYWSAHLVSG